MAMRGLALSGVYVSLPFPALKETNLPGKMVRDGDNRLKAASDQLVPLWRQSQQNPADAVDVNAKTAAIKERA